MLRGLLMVVACMAFIGGVGGALEYDLALKICVAAVAISVIFAW